MDIRQLLCGAASLHPIHGHGPRAHEPTSCCTSIGLAAPCRHLDARRPTPAGARSPHGPMDSSTASRINVHIHTTPYTSTYYILPRTLQGFVLYGPWPWTVDHGLWTTDCGPRTGGLVALRPSPSHPPSQTASPSTKSHDLPDAAFLQFHFPPLPRPCCSVSPSSSSPSLSSPSILIGRGPWTAVGILYPDRDALMH